MPKNVAILIFDAVEVLDFAGPFEIFSVAGGRDTAPAPFNTYTVAQTAAPITARNGLVVTPHHPIDACPPPDIVLIPGGFGARDAMKNPVLLDWVARTHASSELTLSVCTGSLILGAAGLLDELNSTTHHGAYDLLESVAPQTSVIRGVRFVDNGKVVTSAGVQAGMDMALHVVARLLGLAAAEETARYIEYDWRTSEH